MRGERAVNVTDSHPETKSATGLSGARNGVVGAVGCLCGCRGKVWRGLLEEKGIEVIRRKTLFLARPWIHVGTAVLVHSLRLRCANGAAGRGSHRCDQEGRLVALLGRKLCCLR